MPWRFTIPLLAVLCCFRPAVAATCAMLNCGSCADYACTNQGPVCNPHPDRSSCRDSNLCTTDKTCNNGICGGSPVQCPSDQCNDAGACNPNTGCAPMVPSPGRHCSTSPGRYGETCDVHGQCRGGTAVQCSPNTSCMTFTPIGEPECQANPVNIGGPCNADNNACTGTAQSPDHCDSTGACVPGAPVVCVAEDQCHVAGVCDTVSGACSNPAAPNDTPCTSSDPHGSGATCFNGACGPPTQCDGANGYSLCNGVCSRLGAGHCCSNADCHLSSSEGQGTCNLATGTCIATPSLCADGFKACGPDCIPQDACCGSTDCPAGSTCVGNACTIACGPSTFLCGTSCVAQGAGVCCPRDNF